MPSPANLNLVVIFVFAYYQCHQPVDPTPSLLSWLVEVVATQIASSLSPIHQHLSLASTKLHQAQNCISTTDKEDSRRCTPEWIVLYCVTVLHPFCFENSTNLAMM